MSEDAALHARLQLRPGASEKDIRRAYARELRTIDQALQPEAFQELRETYERLLWRLRVLEQQAAPASSSEVTTQAQAGSPAPSADETSPGDVSHGLPTPGIKGSASPEDTAPERMAQAHALARECLDELTGRLERRGFARHEEVSDFLVRCLEGPRLAAVDGRQYFEWAVASILASGWRPGHELLFPGALTVFGWETDRSRLLWLGNPGQVVDAAIAEMAVFDSQPSEHRALQKEVLRALRDDERLKPGRLLKVLPIAEHVAGMFPHWSHVISRPGRLVDWRVWEAAMPGWRRRLARIRPVSKSHPVRPQRVGLSLIGWACLLILGISGLSQLLALNTPPQGPPPIQSSFPGAPVWATKEAGAGTFSSSTPTWQPQQPVVTPEMQAFKDKMFLESLQAARGGDVANAKRRALALAAAKPSEASCSEVASISYAAPMRHQAGEFGGSFDELLLQCAARRLAAIDPMAVQQAADREQQRAERELAAMRQNR